VGRLDRAGESPIVVAQLVTDEHLVEMDVAIDVRRQKQPAPAVGGGRYALSDAWANGGNALPIDDDVGDTAARQKRIPQSPHGRLP